jgi:opacity protein-like surface antigen
MNIKIVTALIVTLLIGIAAAFAAGNPNDENPNRNQYDFNYHIDMVYAGSKWPGKDYSSRLAEHYKNRSDVQVEPSDDEKDPMCTKFGQCGAPYLGIDDYGWQRDRGTGARRLAERKDYPQTYEELEAWTDETIAKADANKKAK